MTENIEQVTDEKIMELLVSINDYTFYVNYEVDIPLYGKHKIELINVVKEWLKENKLTIAIL